MQNEFNQAAEWLQQASHATAFTGAGVSVESGIPPFRGENGLWNTIDPVFLDVHYFYQHPEQSWRVIKDIFYNFFTQAKPNDAHYALATLENHHLLNAIVTQNIDVLHQRAGSKTVIEFHGTSQYLVCTKCNKRIEAKEEYLNNLPPKCSECSGLLKPDFVFFGEPIPEPASSRSYEEAEIADVFLVIGTTGEIQPASMIPIYAKDNDARIIEINTEPSNYTNAITDIFLQGNATEILTKILYIIGL